LTGLLLEWIRRKKAQPQIQHYTIKLMHHISLEDIQLINLIARLGSFAAAAEQLDVPRPNVTRRIKQVEEILGVLLFQRSTRCLTLTAEGEEFIHHCRAIEQQWHTAIDQLQTKQKNLQANSKYPGWVWLTGCWRENGCPNSYGATLALNWKCRPHGATCTPGSSIVT
jgi:molybdate transport repressor ModE-like protein